MKMVHSLESCYNSTSSFLSIYIIKTTKHTQIKSLNQSLNNICYNSTFFFYSLNFFFNIKKNNNIKIILRILLINK
jgi:hypothetical protein